MRIVLLGGSGQVGTVLAQHFHRSGHDVTVIARREAEAPWNVALWDGVTAGQWTQAIDGADVVINLAGRNVNCRYTAANRREIKASRVGSTLLIGEAIRSSAEPPRLWINSSTATIYAHTFGTPHDEANGRIGGNEPGAPSTWNFSIDVATSWENAFSSFVLPRTRKIALRSAIVMIPSRGGAFDALLRLVRFGLGGAMGSGEQFVSWVHDCDFLRAVDFLIANDEIDGPVNVAAPNPLPNCEFMAALRKAWGARVGFPASKWMLEFGAFFLRTETELILKSRRVVSGRLSALGFNFEFPDWPAAAQDLVNRWKKASQH